MLHSWTSFLWGGIAARSRSGSRNVPAFQADPIRCVWPFLAPFVTLGQLMVECQEELPVFLPEDLRGSFTLTGAWLTGLESGRRFSRFSPAGLAREALIMPRLTFPNSLF
jgi:hypothetical protein